MNPHSAGPILPEQPNRQNTYGEESECNSYVIFVTIGTVSPPPFNRVTSQHTPAQKAETLAKLRLARQKVGGEGGIRTHVPVTRQDAFEAPPLRPLRYLSNKTSSPQVAGSPKFPSSLSLPEPRNNSLGYREIGVVPA